jgi:hypothetical protein
MKIPMKTRISAVVMTVILSALFVPQSKAVDSLTNGLVDYWPMTEIDSGVLTPDVAGGNDLLPHTAVNGSVSFATAGITLVPNARGTNSAFSFNAANKSVLAYISSGYPGTIPPELMTNWTFSFWVEGSAAGQAGNRAWASCDTAGANTFYDLAFDPGGTMQIDHFVRQDGSTLGSPYGTFNANGAHVVTTNAPIWDGTWHNVTIEHQTITNMTPAVLYTNVTPLGGQVTLTWNSVPLDSLTNAADAPAQVDTNQNYLIQKSTDLINWTTIATVASTASVGQQYTDVNATQANAFYRVIKPRIRLGIDTLIIDGTKMDHGFQSQPQVNGAAYYPNGVYHANTFAFGGYLRGAGLGAETTIEVSGAAVWNRVLSSNDLAAFLADGVTNASQIQLPASASLSAVFPAVVYGDIDGLSWTASKPPTTLAITPNVGDVTPISVLGIGSTNTVVTSNTVYSLVATRGEQTATSSVPVICVSNVASGWHYIDSFTYLNNGYIGSQGGWQNPLAGVQGTAQRALNVATSGSGNKYVYFDGPQPAVGVKGGIAGRSLFNYSGIVNQNGTLFFRFYIDPNINTSQNGPYGADYPDVDQEVGLTDQGIRDVIDVQGAPNIGFRIFRSNGGNGGVAAPIDLQIADGPGDAGMTPAGYDYLTDANGNPAGLTPGDVYDVWIDYQNIPVKLYTDGVNTNYAVGTGNGYQTNGDLFTVTIQDVTAAGPRVNLLAGITITNIVGVNVPVTNILGTGVFLASRDEVATDTLYPQKSTLGTVFLCEANQDRTGSTLELATNSIHFDDFYINTNGFNSTEPVPSLSMAP